VDSVIEERADAIAIIRLSGRLDFLTSATARERFNESIAAGRTRLVVDLHDLSFIDSSGLGALIGGLKAARQAHGDLRLARPGEQARTVLKLTSLDRVFQAFGTVEDALADF
jgi:anti-anti-sigma factor